MDSSHPMYKTMNLHAKAEETNGNKTLTINCETPFQKFKNPHLTAFYGIEGDEHSANINYDISDTKANLNVVWYWLIMEKMSIDLQGDYEGVEGVKIGAMNAFYLNPEGSFQNLNLGGNVKLNQTWL